MNRRVGKRDHFWRVDVYSGHWPVEIAKGYRMKPPLRHIMELFS